MIHDRRGRNDYNSHESQAIQIKVRVQMNFAQYFLMGNALNNAVNNVVDDVA